MYNARLFKHLCQLLLFVWFLFFFVQITHNNQKRIWKEKKFPHPGMWQLGFARKTNIVAGGDQVGAPDTGRKVSPLWPSALFSRPSIRAMFVIQDFPTRLVTITVEHLTLCLRLFSPSTLSFSLRHKMMLCSTFLAHFSVRAVNKRASRSSPRAR